MPSAAASDDSTVSATTSSSATATTPEEEPASVTRKKDDFLVLAEIGEGSYSTVYLASERVTSRRFAMKVCFKKKILREKKVQQIFRERDILRLLSTPEHSNPFIMRLYCTFQDADSLFFVLTLADRKDLLSRLKSLGGRFTPEQAQFAMAQLWTALEHIHSLHVVHRDVKPENILLRHNGHLLLSDFGCAKRLDVPAAAADGKEDEEKEQADGNDEEKEQADGNDEEKEGKRPPKLKRRCSFVGTAQYVSPEVLNGEEVGPACDWWAFGIILFELLAGRRPFSDESEYLLYRRILRLDYDFTDDFPSEAARQLVRHILMLVPAERFGAVEAGGPLRIHDDPFFAGVDWARLATAKSPLFPEPEEDQP